MAIIGSPPAGGRVTVERCWHRPDGGTTCLLLGLRRSLGERRAGETRSCGTSKAALFHVLRRHAASCGTEAKRVETLSKAMRDAASGRNVAMHVSSSSTSEPSAASCDIGRTRGGVKARGASVSRLDEFAVALTQRTRSGQEATYMW